MQAPKASDSPRRKNRGTGADLRTGSALAGLRMGTASPPKRESILAPLFATYKDGAPGAQLIARKGIRGISGEGPRHPVLDRNVRCNEGVEVSSN